MNREETHALFAEGKDAWNNWAERLLTERQALKAEGKWQVSVDGHGNVKGKNEVTRRWIDAAGAVFSTPHAPHTFETAVNFDGWVLPCRAGFVKAIFQSSAEFVGTVFLGFADFSGATFVEATSFGELKFESSAWFEKATFLHNVWFEGVSFGGHARYLGAEFLGGSASFYRSTFHGEAWFKEAKFDADTAFDHTRFVSQAWFDNASFHDVGFERATFEDTVSFAAATFAVAGFGLARFKGIASFAKTQFNGSADFGAIQGESAFSLMDARFLVVPSFVQAHFAEAPRLDNSLFGSRHLQLKRLWGRNRAKDKTANTPDVSAQWRALKRLAIQGHDHEREQTFFAEELRSLRGTTDWLLPRLWNFFSRDGRVWPGGGRYWFGLLYQAFSDFGRSLMRPLLWWCGGIIVFALAYLDRHFAASAYPTDLVGWVVGRVHERFGAANDISLGLTCLKGDGDPFAAAVYLAVHKGSLVAGLGGDDKLLQAYACLYGEDNSYTASAQQLIPVIPDSVVFLGLLQTVLSATFIFLFLLALRSHFRIK